MIYHFDVEHNVIYVQRGRSAEMSSTNGDGKGNLLISYIFKSDNIVNQVAEESELKVLISQLLISRGYKFAIADDDIIDKGGDWNMTEQEKNTLRELAILVSKEYQRQQPDITFGEWLDQIKDDLEVVKR